MRTQTSRENGISSLYVLKALLAISVVALHSPHTLPWIGLPGLMVELFFVVTGYFLYHPDLHREVHQEGCPHNPDPAGTLCFAGAPRTRKSLDYVLDVV